MKSQEQQTFVQFPFTQTESPTQNYSHAFNQIPCKENKHSTLACISKKCLHYAFVCQDKLCPCISQHKKCLLVKKQTLQVNLTSKKISCQPLETLFCDFIDQFIDKLSQFRESIESRLKNMKISCMGEAQVNFLTKIKQKEVSQITGKQIWQVCFDNKQEQIMEKKFAKNCQYIEEYLNKFQQERVNLFSKINQQLQLLQLPSESYLFESSDIIRSRVETDDLQKMFKQIANAKMLYRASEHNFSVEKFHEICDHVTNTLVLVWTEGDKKIGGYTPLPWLGMIGRYATDESMHSFIFSLTEKDKFVLRQKSSAVYYYNDTSFAFSFGSGADMKISNEADKNCNSRAKINTSYVNNNYEDESAEGYEKFCGNSSSYFKVKEWEVWKVEFENKQLKDL